MTLRETSLIWPFNKFSKKSAGASFAAAILFEENISDTGSFQFRTLARDGYLRNTTVFAAVNEIALNVANLEWEVVDRNGDPKPDTPLARLLAHPNSNQNNLKSFVTAQMSYKLIDGNSFVLGSGMTEGIENGITTGELSGPPGLLEIIEPDRAQVKDDDGEVIGYKIMKRVGQAKQAGLLFPPSRVWHSKLFNPLNQHRGISPMVPSALEWKTNNESKRWNFSMLKRGGRPSGILSVDKSLDKATIQRITEDADNRFAGSNNAGKIMILQNVDGGMKWTETAVTPKDADWIKGMKHMELNIAKAYQVPPEILGDSSNKTYSNYQEARKSFYSETVIPHADIIKAELNRFLLPLFKVEGDLLITFDKNKIEAIQEDMQSRRQELRVGYGVGLVKPNEYRKASGLELLEGKEGEQRVVPLNLVPVETMLEGSTQVSENDPPKD